MFFSGSSLLCQWVHGDSQLSCIRFSGTSFMLISLIHLDLFLCRVIDINRFAFSTCWHPVRPALFFENAFFFLLYNFDFFVKNHVDGCMDLFIACHVILLWVATYTIIDISFSPLISQPDLLSIQCHCPSLNAIHSRVSSKCRNIYIHQSGQRGFGTSVLLLSLIFNSDHILFVMYTMKGIEIYQQHKIKLIILSII